MIISKLIFCQHVFSLAAAKSSAAEHEMGHGIFVVFNTLPDQMYTYIRHLFPGSPLPYMAMHGKPLR